MSEVVLLGQTVNSYHDGDYDFADLLRAVGAVQGIRRLRFTSPHPNDFSPGVIRAMAETEAHCEHVHLPMQSGSTRTLKRMLRRYTREQYLECVDKLRAAIPDVSLTTDDVGFRRERCGFRGDLSAVQAVGFDATRSSSRCGRNAWDPATRVDRSGRNREEQRLARLIATVRGGTRLNLKLLGERREVLVEKPARRTASGATRDPRL